MSIIQPENYIKHICINNHKFSGLCHIFFNSAYVRYFEKYKLTQIVNLNTIQIYSIKLQEDAYIAVIRNGASLSAIDFEVLIYWGFTEFIVYGYACSIGNGNLGNLFLIGKAYIGDGVSRYYTNNKEKQYVVPSITLNNKILQKLSRAHKIHMANCYTTDALFMETKQLVDSLIRLNIDCIDMECSALTTISNYRNINISFIFAISDTIRNGKWEYNNKINLRETLVNVLLSLYL